MLSGQIHNSAELIELIDRIGFLPLLDCGGKGTSCPDQLCRALEQLKQS